jgi:hypothetical protein
MKIRCAEENEHYKKLHILLQDALNLHLTQVGQVDFRKYHNNNNNNNNNNNKIIHQKLAKGAEVIDDNCPYYKYTPANVLQNENFKLYWNRSTHTDKTIPFNRRDITFMNNKTKNTFLIDTAVPNTHNLAETITDKQNKYQELANEIRATWKQKAAQVIPIVISSTGVIPKSLSQSVTRLNLHPNTYKQLQKSAILGTCSTVRKFLNYK